jgi:hypothetical protein
MSRDKGNRAAAWLAEYLQPWWPGCEKTPNSRPGRDVLGTPGVSFECKTGVEWRAAWLAQCLRNTLPGEVGMVVYLPPGCGARNVGEALAIMPLWRMMPLLVAAGYAPSPNGRAAQGSSGIDGPAAHTDTTNSNTGGR